MIYIQQNNNGIPHHFDCACAMYGSMELGLDYKLITFEEVENGKWDSLIRSNLFVGSVEFMTEVFSRIGIDQPRLPLNNFRSSSEIKLKDFKYEKPVFIKPKSIKAFTGFVLDEYSHSMLKGLDQDLELIIQEVIPNVFSEWRGYIFRNKLVDIRHYSGELDIDLKTTIKYIQDQLTLIKLLKKEIPNTFTIDIMWYTDFKRMLGSEKPKITVVELNDMWAIGNYGVPNDLYVRMLKERYFDIIKKGK